MSDLTVLKDAGPRNCHWASAEDYLGCSKVGNRRPTCLANCSSAAIWRGRFETTPIIMLNKSNETSFMCIHTYGRCIHISWKISRLYVYLISAFGFTCASDVDVPAILFCPALFLKPILSIRDYLGFGSFGNDFS